MMLMIADDTIVYETTLLLFPLVPASMALHIVPLLPKMPMLLHTGQFGSVQEGRYHVTGDEPSTCILRK